MIAFGYEATGLATDDIFIGTFDKTGKLKREVRIKQPYVSIIHDMAVTQKHILLPFGGYVTEHGSPQGEQGPLGLGSDQAEHDRRAPARRRSEGRALVQGPRALHDATFNAYTEGNKVILYAPFWDSNFFPFFPPVDGSPVRSRQGEGLRAQDHPRSQFEERYVEGRDSLAVPDRGPRARRYALHDAE